MIESIQHLMTGFGATWVLWLLFTLSFVSLAIAIDRGLAFWSRRDDVLALSRELHALLMRGDLEEARTRLVRSPSAEAAIALAGLDLLEHGAAASREAMAAATGVERARLERRLGFLGTVGNNAPFVGLLGTVIGIVGAFEQLGRGSVGQSISAGLPAERVMSSIAEALVATAVGLVVAIPAVVFFNYFQGLLAATLGNAETLGHVVLSHAAKGDKHGQRE